jgi:predicted Zn finger-like uncharacterized protein
MCDRGVIMIIECEKCQTKYRFDESLMEGDGVWVRCSHCKYVFFQENPSREEDAVLFDSADNDKESIDVEVEREIGKEIPVFDEFPEGAEEDDEKKAGRGKEKSLWTPKKAFAYTLIVILVLAGVYLWLFPQTRKQILDKVSPYMSAGRLKENSETTNEKVGEVGFLNVKERYAKNWILGEVLVIEGVVVNRYNYPISKVKVRGKILSESGEVLDMMESYCGNILTDEELKNLTEKEIEERLSTPGGSDVSNSVSPQGNIPFMIVFTNPSKEAEEFIVELAKNSPLSE